MRLFWDQARGGRNFGDALSAELFRRAGIDVTWAPPESADVFAIGSAAEAIPPGYTGVVFGTGKMFASSALDLRRARVLALRGALTAEGARADCNLLADPGLLVADLARPTRQDIETGWIPHYVDRRQLLDAHHIDILGGVAQVIAEVGRCRRIVSSSLHGLVLADALGIPNRWDPHQRVLGEGFKFRDYASSYGETIRPGVWRLADQNAVQVRIDRLRDALHAVIEEVRIE